MVLPFPRPGRRVECAYAELDFAAGTGTLLQQEALGDPRLLGRPWDPASCVDPDLRAELWEWLDQVVIWLNREYVWDAEAMIPSCWPRHPHLVHEIAVLADLRRGAGLALTGDPLEEWHRYALPAFIDRMRGRLREHCQDGAHQPWPALGRDTRHRSDRTRQVRLATYRADCDALARSGPTAASGTTGRPAPLVIDGLRADARTGEVLD